MSTQQDIYAAGSKSRPHMLNKENYVPWSSRLLRYAKSRPNGKLIHNSILNGPYVRKMSPEPGDANRDLTVTETFNFQTDDELSDKELKQIETDDQAIQTILLSLPEDIYATVDSCETAQEIWLRVQQMMKGSDIGIQEKNAKLFNEWEMFTSNEGESIESYYHRFLKLMNELKRNKHFPEKIASNLNIQAKLLNTNQQHLENFIKPKNMQIAQPGMNMGQDRQMQMGRGNDENQFRQYAGQNAGNPTGYNDVIGNQVIQNAVQNPRVQNVVRAEGNAAGQNRNQIRCYNCRGVGHYARNYTLSIMQMIGGNGGNQLRQYVGQNTGNLAGYNDVIGNQYTELLEPISESHQVPQNDNDVISEDTSVEQGGETVKQHPANFKETRALYESLYQNLENEVEKVNSVNRKLKETNADMTTDL
nr:hypothetical protein [Tanacetum cinerariifolium]